MLLPGSHTVTMVGLKGTDELLQEVFQGTAAPGSSVHTPYPSCAAVFPSTFPSESHMSSLCCVLRGLQHPRNKPTRFLSL